MRLTSGNGATVWLKGMVYTHQLRVTSMKGSGICLRSMGQGQKRFQMVMFTQVCTKKAAHTGWANTGGRTAPCTSAASSWALNKVRASGKRTSMMSTPMSIRANTIKIENMGSVYSNGRLATCIMAVTRMMSVMA